MIAQNDTELKTVMQQEGRLTKVSVFHENGQLAQEGYLKNNLLHGKWIKYTTDGKLVCVGTTSVVKEMERGCFGIKMI